MEDTVALRNPADAAPMDRHGLERLLAAVAIGDAQAFERLYHATSAKMFGVCLRLLADRDEAEDAVQEAYAAIWRKAAQYDASIASPISWLAMIAHNKAVDRLRSDGTARNALPIEFAADVSDTAPGAPALAEHAGETRQLDRCLNQLEARRRTLIRTAFFEGATYEELARRTDTPIGTVKSWIRRGLMQLRTCLES
uniref:RNA polymerase sigma factor n=1 Tax=uncultured bacterium lac153 TaxID=1447239 RepID=X2LCH1_9BACT|nr:RNA polymerase sigma factor [uncultured bacterium lac153]